MTTVRQMERLWNARSFSKLLRDMLAHRVDGVFAMEAEMNLAPAAVAAALIRLDELGQSHLPLSSNFIKFLLMLQGADGGWGDVATTALVLKALMTCKGAGATIDRGLQYLANLQKEDGLWPKIPIKRTASDPLISAFVLQQLGHEPRFHAAVRVDDALGWYGGNQPALDPTARRAWDRAVMRCNSVIRTSRMKPGSMEPVWS